MRLIATTISLFAIATALMAGCGSEDDTGTDSDAFRPRRCGNGRIDRGEQCDGRNLNGQTCASVTMGLRPNGTLSCNRGCRFDTSRCRRGGTGGTGGDGGTGGGTGATGGAG